MTRSASSTRPSSEEVDGAHLPTGPAQSTKPGHRHITKQGSYWPSLVVYGLAAGTLAAGAAHLIGGMGLAITGRRTSTTALLQILGVILVVGTAGIVADRVVMAVRRKTYAILNRSF